MDTGKENWGFSGLTYSERVAVDSTDDSSKYCNPGTLNATLASEKIILCFSKSDKVDMVNTSLTVAEAGGVGLILAQFHNDGLPSCDLIPCVKVDYEVGTEILSYIRTAR